MRRMRRRMQIIFQDPYSSLNPRMTVLDIVGEALAIHGIARGHEREQRVQQLLERVGLSARYVNRYPHEFSGGQRQRIGVARALALNPDFIVCDEAVSALDVSVQAQVINLLLDLREEFGLAYLFIAHDLSVVRHISDRIAVMYLGEIVETTGADDLFERPLHPYTQALLSAVPVADPTRERSRIVLEGDVPTPINPPSGCHFHPRCRYAEDICKQLAPGVTDAGDGHIFRCHVAARDFPESATTPVEDETAES
jgi:oligopeptide/dipeptide ABC transporter ATP-binding protein